MCPDSAASTDGGGAHDAGNSGAAVDTPAKLTPDAAAARLDTIQGLKGIDAPADPSGALAALLNIPGQDLRNWWRTTFRTHWWHHPAAKGTLRTWLRRALRHLQVCYCWSTCVTFGVCVTVSRVNAHLEPAEATLLGRGRALTPHPCVCCRHCVAPTGAVPAQVHLAMPWQRPTRWCAANTYPQSRYGWAPCLSCLLQAAAVPR